MHHLTKSKQMTHHQSARFNSGSEFLSVQDSICLLAIIFTCPLTVMSQMNSSLPGVGNWSDPCPLVSLGHVPMSGESVTIVNGSTISVNVNTTLINSFDY
jgi:hypothetical protein